MKFNQPDLFGGVGPMATPDPSLARATETIRTVINVIQDEVANLAQSGDRLVSTGALAPSWAFAMYYAALLLVSHGPGALQDAHWLSKVERLKSALDTISRRWKIAGEPFFLPGDLFCFLLFFFAFGDVKTE